RANMEQGQSSVSRQTKIPAGAGMTQLGVVARLDGEAGAAAAGGDHIGIADLEALADQVVDIVDLGPAHEFQAHRIDQHYGIALAQNGIVAARLFLYEV